MLGDSEVCDPITQYFRVDCFVKSWLIQQHTSTAILRRYELPRFEEQPWVWTTSLNVTLNLIIIIKKYLTAVAGFGTSAGSLASAPGMAFYARS